MVSLPRTGRPTQLFTPPGEAGADLWDPYPDGEGPQGTGRLHTSQWLLPGMDPSPLHCIFFGSIVVLHSFRLKVCSVKYIVHCIK